MRESSATAGLTITAAAKVTVNASQVAVSAGMVTVDAGNRASEAWNLMYRAGAYNQSTPPAVAAAPI